MHLLLVRGGTGDRFQIAAQGFDGTVIETFKNYTDAGRWAHDNNVIFTRATVEVAQ